LPAGGEGERKKRSTWMELRPVGKKKGTADKRRTEEKEKWSSPKDLCAILENYRDLSVKHSFLIKLKP
jgi:hypothetical protein